MQKFEKEYETNSYIDGSELTEYKNNINAIYPNGISSCYPIDFFDKYRIKDDPDLKNTRDDINAVSIIIPPTVNIKLDDEVYKEYLIHLYKTCLNSDPTEEQLNNDLKTDVFSTTKNIILYSGENVSELTNFEFIELLYYCIFNRQASTEAAEKYAGYIDNEQCSKEDLIGNFLNSEEFTIATVDYYKRQIKKNKDYIEAEGLEEKRAVDKRNKNKTEIISQEMFNAYMAQVYLVTLGNNETCISDEILSDLYDYYNLGYDLEECLIKMFSTTTGSKYMSKMAEAGNEQYVRSMYESILGVAPSAFMKKISQNNLKFEKRFSWAKRNIIYSYEFKKLKKDLANNIYEPIKFLDEKKVSVEIYTRVKGDLNGDLKVNAQDARIILRVIIDATLGNEDKYMPYIYYLDINGDKEVNVLDAQEILRYYAFSIKSNEQISLMEYLKL